MKDYELYGIKHFRNLVYLVQYLSCVHVTSNLAKSLRKPEIKKSSHGLNNQHRTIAQILTRLLTAKL
jgi:hypothetical protein